MISKDAAVVGNQTSRAVRYIFYCEKQQKDAASIPFIKEVCAIYKSLKLLLKWLVYLQ